MRERGQHHPNLSYRPDGGTAALSLGSASTINKMYILSRVRRRSYKLSKKPKRVLLNANHDVLASSEKVEQQ
jgi:hypothetical protein